MPGKTAIYAILAAFCVGSVTLALALDNRQGALWLTAGFVAGAVSAHLKERRRRRDQQGARP